MRPSWVTQNRLADAGQQIGQAVSALLRLKSAVWLLIALFGCFVMIGHQSLAPIDRDEARFSQASKQMLADKDFVTIRFQDAYRAKKPAGIYWLQALSAAMFGEDDIASYRLPSLAGYLCVMLLIAAFARAMNLTHFGGRAPAIAAMMIGASFIIFAEAHLAKTDSVLLALILWQQMALFDIYKRRFDGQAGAAVYQFWIALGLGVLVKGPISPVVAAATIALLVVFDRQLLLLRLMRMMRGLLIVLVIVAPWAVSVQIATNGAFLDIAIKADFLAKVQSAQESHGAPAGVYLALFGLLAFPASLFAGQLAMIGKDLFKRDKGRFLVAWAVGYWVIIELTPTKLPHYILPVLPALMLLILLCFAYPAKPSKWRIYLSYLVMALVSISGLIFVLGLGYLSLRFGGAGSGASFFTSLICLALMSLVLVWMWQWTKAPEITKMVLVLVSGAVIHMLVVSVVISGAMRIHPSTAVAKLVTAQEARPTVIAAAGYHEPSLVFLLGRDVLLVEETEAALILAEAPDGLAIIEGRKQAAFLAVADKLSLTLAPAEVIDGFNISKGADITLYLYRRASQ